MRKKILYKILVVGLMLGGLTSCYENEVSEVIDPTDHPMATFTTSTTGSSVTEEDQMIIDIVLDKPLEWSVSFDVIIKEGSVADDHDIVITGGEIPAFKKSTEIVIDFVNDNIITDETKKIIFEVEIHDDLAKKYLLSPETVYPAYELDIHNKNKEGTLTLNFGWDSDADFDMVTWSDTETYPMEAWGDGGATGANPEIDQSILLADPVGTYYVNVMDWGEGAFDYKFTIGHPDGTIQTINGTFTGDYASYVNDPWTAWGDSYDSYRVLKVENDGTKFVVTEL